MTVQREPVVVDSVERLASMSAEEVDDLPYGFLVLDRDGVIQMYNRYESRMSRLPAERVIGRNWFRDVAPCTRVEGFQGRFRRLIDDPSQTSDRFAFRFHFLHGAQDVVVEMTRSPADPPSVFMTVVRRNLEGPGVDAPRAVTLDEEAGRLNGPTGVALAIPASTLARLLDEVRADEAREAGATIGRAVAGAGQREADAVGEPSLDVAPLQLRSGLVDAAFARAGLGRIALDLSALERDGVIGVVVRPPSDQGGPGLAAFYEGVLAAVLASCTGRAQVARCLGAPHALPWLFAAVPVEDAARLTDVGQGEASTHARALGLSLG